MLAFSFFQLLYSGLTTVLHLPPSHPIFDIQPSAVPTFRVPNLTSTLLPTVAQFPAVWRQSLLTGPVWFIPIFQEPGLHPLTALYRLYILYI